MNAIASRLDIKKLQDVKFVQTLTSQYLLTMQQQAQAGAGTGAGDLASLLAPRSSGLTV